MFELSPLPGEDRKCLNCLLPGERRKREMFESCTGVMVLNVFSLRSPTGEEGGRKGKRSNVSPGGRKEEKKGNV